MIQLRQLHLIIYKPACEIFMKKKYIMVFSLRKCKII